MKKKCLMKNVCYLILFFAIRVYSQDINLELDTAISDQPFYYKKYDLLKAEKTRGEGWELVKLSKLKHAFYGDVSGNSFYLCGTWAMTQDSIIFLISDKKLLKNYGYKNRESFKPLVISWDLKTDLKNSGNLLVFKNKLVVLNNGVEPNELLDQMQTLIDLNLKKWKSDANPEDAFYFFRLNEKVMNEFKDLLYERNLFSSIETFRKYE